MNAANWIALGSAVVSVLSFLGTIIFSWRAAASARNSRDVAIGAAESSLRSAISTTRQRVEDRALQIATILNGRRRCDLKVADERMLEPHEKAFRSAVEDNLNAYEDACAKYRDGKIDIARFKKMYINEIQNLCVVKDSPITEFMNPEGASKFQAIWRVYREWHIHE
jgi:hypothetical protein